MDDYPSNSHKRAKPVTAPDEAPKKVEKIIEGEVVRRKKPLGKRFAELFITGDRQSVGQYILLDILLPAAKDTIADVVTQGIERTLWGEARSTSRRSGQRPNSGHTNYGNRFQTTNSPYGRPEPRQLPSRRSRANHNFDEIILKTRVDAEEVIDNLFMLVSKYESASVADLYEMLGIEGVPYTDDKWGWTDLRGAGITRVNNGYLLDLPKPEALD
jgi:hypothetical protein